MTCIANVTTKPDEHEEIEITEEMINEGVTVLLASSFLDISPGIAEDLVERVLRHAWSIHRNRIRVIDQPTD
jgi:hypothetical protein